MCKRRGIDNDARTLLDAQQQPVILCLNARFQIYHGVWSTNHRIEDGADGASNDEMRAEIVQVVGAQHVVISKLPLNADIHLLHHRVLHSVVDDINARRPRARQDEPGKRISQCRRARRKHAHESDRNRNGRRNEKYGPARTSTGNARPSRPRSND